MSYKVVTYNEHSYGSFEVPTKFEEEVSDYIKQGYIPAGKYSYSDGETDDHGCTPRVHIQALYKPVEKPILATWTMNC